MRKYHKIYLCSSGIKLYITAVLFALLLQSLYYCLGLCEQKVALKEFLLTMDSFFWNPLKNLSSTMLHQIFDLV